MKSENLEDRQLLTDLGGNSFSAATLVTTDSDRVIYEDVGYGRDNDDYFKINLTRQSVVDIYMTNMSQNINLRLYNSNGTQLASSTRSGSSNESIERTLAAGTYILRADPWGSAESSYRLSIDINAIVPPDRAGNSFGAARSIGTFNNNTRTFSDFVSSGGDRLDYYRFDVTATTVVDLNLTNLTANADLYLYDSSGRYITASWNSGSNNETIHRELTRGTYYALVYGRSGDTTYNLSVAGTAAVAPPDRVTVRGTAASATEVELTWNDASNEDRYHIYRWNGSSAQYVGTNNRDSTSFTVNNLEAGQRHWFFVQSQNSAGSTNSFWVFADTPAASNSTLSIPVDWWGGNYHTTANGFRDRGYAPSQFGGWQLGSAAGNCTWYVEGRLRQTAGITGINTSRLTGLRGHAKDWESRTGVFQTTSTPQVGAVAQWESGGYGHVAFVEQVNADGSIVISESSYVSNNPGNNPANFLHRTRTIRPGGSGGILGGSWPTRFLVVLA